MQLLAYRKQRLFLAGSDCFIHILATPRTICLFFSLSSVVRFATYCSFVGGSRLEAGIRRSRAFIVFSELASYPLNNLINYSEQRLTDC